MKPLALLKNNIVKLLFFLSIVSFLWVSNFAILYHANNMGIDSVTNNCLFSSPAESCNMTLSEHIDIWKSMFTTVPENIFLSVILIIATFLLVYKQSSLLRELYARLNHRWRFYINRYNTLLIINPLKEALSSGILNPKTF